MQNISTSPVIESSILDKPRLFTQLGLPPCSHPTKMTWTRSADFFGDGFKLWVTATNESIDARWIHTAPNGTETTIWALSLDQTSTGRARILYSEGFSPPLRSVQRAAEAIRLSISQTQAPVRRESLKHTLNVLPSAPLPLPPLFKAVKF